jgi:predicted nuclease of predicted toxin-antitoxin system
MRFLLDENLSPRLADPLRAAGHNVTHVHDAGLTGAGDDRVIATARDEGRVLVSADTDFGTILARSGARNPSFLLMRRASGRRAADQAQLILENLAAVTSELETGAIVVLGETTIRIRRLPIGGA